MTGERVKEVCDLYIAKLDRQGHEPEQIGVGTPSTFGTIKDNWRALSHVHWMAIETKKFVDEGRLEKAMRWLGFMQGWLTFTGAYTIADTMKHNMPPEAKFDGAA